MLVLFGFALLVLAAAMVVLFAMMGELSSRVPEPGSIQRDTTVRPVEEAKIGHAPGVWPEGLPDPAGAVLLVLSTACGSCKQVAEQLGADRAHTDWPELAVVVSTAGRQTGQEFVAAHGLDRFPHYIDEGGEWIMGEFGVQLSPTALVLRSGKLTSAYVFNDVASLRKATENPIENPVEELVEEHIDKSIGKPFETAEIREQRKEVV